LAARNSAINQLAMTRNRNRNSVYEQQLGSHQRRAPTALTGQNHCAQNGYVDEDGMHLEIVGWHRSSKSGQKRYLVKYTRPELPGRSTHALLDDVWIPMRLRSGYTCPQNHDIADPSNQGGSRIRRINQILRPLDMAWYSPPSPDCTASCADYEIGITSYRLSGKRESKFNDFFILIEWRDDEGNLLETWEFAELLMGLMDDQGHCMSLLGRWADEVETRHFEMLNGLPPSHIDRMTRAGWHQYS
jgi:hypothetical protein